MSKLTLLIGLPASGKTTWAKQIVRDSNGKVKRVCKDDLRAMIDAGVSSKKNEQDILTVQWDLTEQWLKRGYDVIVDNTNFHHSHLKEANMIIDSLSQSPTNLKFELEVKFFDTPLEECIRRDSLRPNPVGKKVIMQMWNQYLKPEPPKYNPELEDCIIVDIDGTLAINNGRNPFDETKVLDDLPNYIVLDMIYNYYSGGDDKPKIIIFSGRTDSCRADTEKWLNKYLELNYQLYMRKTGDNRPDDIIKRELYEEHIKDKYNVNCVFDDRMRVCRLWHSLGLFTFCVNQGFIEF